MDWKWEAATLFGVGSGVGSAEYREVDRSVGAVIDKSRQMRVIALGRMLHHKQRSGGQKPRGEHCGRYVIKAVEIIGRISEYYIIFAVAGRDEVQRVAFDGEVIGEVELFRHLLDEFILCGGLFGRYPLSAVT